MPQPERSRRITQLLNEYFTEMSNIALRHGGTIDKFVGDAMLIFFGDPETKGEAEDIGVNSLLRASAAQVSEAELARFGLYRPFDPTDDPGNTEVNHVQLIPHGGPVPVTVVDDTFDPDPSCT